MKKFLYVLSISFLIFQSCSSVDNPNSNTSNILCRQIVTTFSGGDVETINYTYDNNKLVSIMLFTQNTSYKTLVFYTGNLVTKTEDYDINNILEGKDTYSYNSNNELITHVHAYANRINFVYQAQRTVYTYNSNGTITSTLYGGDLINQNTLVSSSTLSYSNGEISSEVKQGSSTSINTFTYDTKNNPFKNIVGYDKIVITNPGAGLNHNQIQSAFNGTIYNTQYSYDTNDFPITSSSLDSGETETKQYYY